LSVDKEYCWIYRCIQRYFSVMGQSCGHIIPVKG
jgi:hypothetical protein